MIGGKLGPYEITAKLGEGGMGEVWRAKDSQLGREVALKVLPEAFTADPERTARFEREAKVVASLNHPNIAQIYGFEASGETRALVMELVEGPTLADRLESGSLPFDESLSIARQIAEALEEAHEKGIIHRDLKPQNVKASVEGKVKVLDFGLAKAMDPAGAASGAASASQLAASPTLTLGATVQGVILGSAAYMAPEQAKGFAVDKRADIWAFGVVLCEMLTGRRLFDGDTVPETLAGVLKSDIDLEALPTGVPPAIRRLLRRCLERNPKNRLHDIADARLVIDDVLAGRADEANVAPGDPAPATAPRRWPLQLALAAMTVAAVLLGALVVRQRLEPPKIVRSSILSPPDRTFYLQPGRPGPVALSPDGRQLAFTAADAEGHRSLWVRAVEAIEARELPGTDEGHYPFWSPDSQQLGFFTETHLKKIAVAGGPPVTLAEASAGKGGTWTRGGRIVFAPAPNAGLSVMASSGGATEPVTELAQGDVSHRHPRSLPDDESFLFVARRNQGGSELRVGSLDGSPPVALLPTEANAEYADGRLLFLRESTLMAQPFDVGTRRLSGEPVPIAQEILRIPGALVGVVTASQEGTLAYQTGKGSADVRLVWRDRDGNELGTIGEPTVQQTPRLSPDGRSLAVEIDDAVSGERDLWIYDLQSGLRSRFTFDPANDTRPLWSPDGQTLVFNSAREGGTDTLWAAPVTGTEPPRRLTRSDQTFITPDSWSPDGRWIVASALGTTLGDIVRLPVEGGEPQPLVADRHNQQEGVVSPDGRWISYRSNETGRTEVYVTSYPEAGRKWQVSRGDGSRPTWRGDGRELYYRDDTGLYAVEIDGRGPLVEIGATRRLFDLPATFSSTRQYDVSRDGSRFVVAEPVDAKATVSPITLVLNWTAELPER